MSDNKWERRERKRQSKLGKFPQHGRDLKNNDINKNPIGYSKKRKNGRDSTGTGQS